MQLTHLNAHGEANMVDVGDKRETRREAVASGRIVMQPNTLQLLSDGALPKGDVLATARIAGIQAAKRTHELIPLCHSLALSKVAVDFDIDHANGWVNVSAMCRLNGRTGVEMGRGCSRPMMKTRPGSCAARHACQLPMLRAAAKTLKAARALS